MAAPATSSIIRVPGRLVWNPTDLGQAEPYGGTYLGTCRGVRFTPRPKYRDIWAEEFGSMVDSFYVGEGPCELTAIVRYPDEDMIATTAPRVVASGSSGIRWLFRPGGTTQNTRAGTSMFSRAGQLLFAPKAAADHPMILLRNALPLYSEDLELRLALNEEYGISVRFLGTPDSSGRVYESARRANIAL